jgi:hypothetical protein
MNCPGSVALIGDQSSTTNHAAMLGTAAHKIIELMILADQHDAREYAGGAVLVKADGDEETEVYMPGVPALDPDNPRPGWFMFMVDERMVDSVQHTIDEVDRLKEQYCEGTEVFAERYLDMTWLDSRLGGTADVTLVEPFGWAHLVDHKNGFVLVEAKDNDQLKQYAVGVAHEHPDCEGVRVTISQPNAPHIEGTIRMDEFTIDELKMYEIRMKEAADATSKPNAPLRAGDWCTYCPAKTRCKEFDAVVLAEAQADFAEEPPDEPLPTPVNTEELARKGRWVPILDAWKRQIEGDIQRELENGNAVPGFKLVQGKSNRKWLDETETKRVFVEEIEIDETALFDTPKMKSPAQLEKLGPRNQRAAIKRKVAELSHKPPGKLTVATIDDPREAASPLDEAVDEFSDLTGDDSDFV